jgi:hypothetical protein
MQASQATIRTGYVAGEFLTRTYRISGEVELGGTPLLDQLNDHQAFFIALHRMFISPLLDPARLVGNFLLGNVRKDNIGLAVLTQARDGLPHREGQYVGRDYARRDVLMVVAGFEVQGVLTLHPTVNLHHFIRTTPEHFVPLFDATATVASRGEIVFQGGAILVNRNWIEVFATLPD